MKTATTPGMPRAAAGVDTGDAGMRDGTAQDRQVLHPGQHEVVGPPGAAGDQMLVFLAQPGLADFRFGGGGHRTPPAVSAFAASVGRRRRRSVAPPRSRCAASCTALTMFWYPVQRHRLPSRPCRTVSSSGSGSSASRSSVCMIMPGVQKPHCNAWLSRNASWTGCSVPSPGQALDGEDVAAVGLHGEHRAGLDAVAVQVNGARTAVAGVAADHGADLAEPVTQVVHEEQPRLHLVRICRSVDGDSDAHRASNARSVR